jgi:hypothetical protein
MCSAISSENSSMVMVLDTLAIATPSYKATLHSVSDVDTVG